MWSDDLDHIVPLCNEFDEKLMKLVWQSRSMVATPSFITSINTSSAPSATDSDVNLNEKAAIASDGVMEAATKMENAAAENEAPQPERKFWSWKLSSKKYSAKTSSDAEKGSGGPQARPIRLFAPVYGGIGCALSICKYPVLSA